MKPHVWFASADDFLSRITNSNEELVYVTWQLFYTISWPLKNLKETVVFYCVFYNLLAFKDDFPWFFLPVVLPVLRAVGIHGVAGGHIRSRRGDCAEERLHYLRQLLGVYVCSHVSGSQPSFPSNLSNDFPEVTQGERPG